MRSKRNIPQFIALALLGLLSIPMFQGGLNLVEVEPLRGAFTTASKPEFSWSAWFEGTWQEEVKSYANDNTGFRPSLVRLQNQMNLSLYGTGPNVVGVVIGKDDILLEESYIHTLTGKDFIGTDSLHSIGRGLNQVRDTLASKGIELIVVLAPGKGYFYRDKIPEKYNMQPVDTTNFEVIVEQLDKYNIEYINCRSWFEAMKDTSRYLLYPKNGIHWSRYAEFIFADSLINRLEAVTGHDYPNIHVHSLEVTNNARFTDGDIEVGMNLLFDIEDDTLAYPGFVIEKDTARFTHKVLTIADSYYWDLFNMGMSKDVFNHGQFWYYCAAVYPDSKGEDIVTVWDIDYTERIEQNDAIVLICTDANLHRFPFGLIKQMRAYYEMPYVPKE